MTLETTLAEYSGARPHQGVAGSLENLVIDKNKSKTSKTNNKTTAKAFQNFGSTPAVHKVSLLAAETIHGATLCAQQCCHCVEMSPFALFSTKSISTINIMLINEHQHMFQGCWLKLNII